MDTLFIVLHISADINQIFLFKKEYCWPRPERCPSCQGKRLWGHGYVERWFDGYAEPAWFKRYRCPDCGTVHTLKPLGWWPRFQAPAAVILESIQEKVNDTGWQSGPSRQRQQYWFRGFKKHCVRMFGALRRSSRPMLERLRAKDIIIATHSIQFFQVIRV